MGEFERVQARLPGALAANVAGSGVEHVVLAMASYSVGESLLSHYVERIPAMEHRYLNALLLLNRIGNCEFVFLCSEAPAPEVLDYYRTLVAPEIGERLRTRACCIVVADRGARSLAAKLLDRPDVVADVRDLIGDRVAMIEPWNVTADEVAVAIALDVPINGTAPELRPLAFKSAGRRLFAAAGVPVPIGCEDVRDVDGVLAAIEHIRARRPDAVGVVVKHDDSGAGDGNTIVALRDADAVAAGRGGAACGDRLAAGLVPRRSRCRRRRRGTRRRGANLQPERAVRHVPRRRRPSTRHPRPTPRWRQRTGLRGLPVPRRSRLRDELAHYGVSVGAELARRGAIGRASADFIAAHDSAGGWRLHGLEINLRKGGTTHPYAALRNLVPGATTLTPHVG